MNDTKKAKEFTIIVNGREKTFEGKEITFDEVVILAHGSLPQNPLIFDTITYKKGDGSKKEGTMEKDDIVKIKNGTIFNVTRTDKS